MDNRFSGSHSEQAIQMLQDYEITAELYNLQSGMLAWNNAGLPFVT